MADLEDVLVLWRRSNSRHVTAERNISRSGRNFAEKITLPAQDRIGGFARNVAIYETISVFNFLRQMDGNISAYRTTRHITVKV
jgi:hypothetical protein